MLEFLFNKVAGLRPANLFERDFNTGVLLRVSQNVSEKLFLQESSGGICRSSLLNQKQCWLVSTKKVCRSGHGRLFTHY